ncbi:hypothetical protein RBSWK_03189 [Rhodopirellula baltica SWK14]|uniref:Mg chelatase-related protein C-terminal domain-containing protein n=1 Tax=Rhodopirellula baltica SWK14 TaxID=993516 RepID=L7CG93_RHOBT|nr:hypothetical protein RBSWK_03189 [Rhodopirellula baltica SWK14]
MSRSSDRNGFEIDVNEQSDASTWTSKQVRENCSLDAECQSMLRKAVMELGLSARNHDNILRAAISLALEFGNSAISV